MPYPAQTFPDFATLATFINQNWITNGNGDIDAVIGNDVVNGLLTFVEQSPLNWQTAQVISAGGVASVTSPVAIVITNTPASITWGNNIYNQFIIVNTTNDAIPIAGSLVYFDINLAAKNSIPAKTVLNIVKASNGLWISVTTASQSASGKPPLIRICTEDGSGGTPIAGSSIYENSALIGLGATNGNKFQMVLNGIVLENYGDNPGFIYTDPDNGIVDISPVGTFQLGNGLYVNLNQ